MTIIRCIGATGIVKGSNDATPEAFAIPGAEPCFAVEVSNEMFTLYRIAVIPRKKGYAAWFCHHENNLWKPAGGATSLTKLLGSIPSVRVTVPMVKNAIREFLGE